MLLKIGQRPEHGFDEPLGLLSDCHRRIEHFLSVLSTITDRAAGAALDSALRAELQGALTYFETAAPRHTADEEESLFPRLQASQDPQACAALDLVRRLEHDHREAENHHAVVDRLGRQWLDDVLSKDEHDELQQRLARLRALYQAHIAVEDAELFPAAARVLSSNEITEIGREMAARRSARP
jgi:hemerythrin-like domain-containing protein